MAGDATPYGRTARSVTLTRDWLLPLLWLGTLIAVGNADLVPVRGTSAPLFALRKLIHVGEYAILGALFCRALALDRRRMGRRLEILALTLTVASGGIDESQQSFVAGRAPRLTDLGFDTIGAALGLAWASIVRQRRRTESLRHGYALNERRRVHMLSAKRGFDLLLSGLGLVASAPLWGVIAVAVRWEDGGPIFFRDLRVGQNEDLFTAFKFRTMVRDADSLFGPRQATEDDPRVTRVGRLLRATAMDELPQLWNIFCGDMSFVGPRALRPGEIEVRSAACSVRGSTCNVEGAGAEAVTPLEQIPGYRKRHVVRPGLTGIAQIFADRDIPSRQKFRYDLLYIRRQGFWLDVWLVALSFWVTFRGRWEVRGTKF